MPGSQLPEVCAGGGEREGVSDAETDVELNQIPGVSFHLPTGKGL